MYRSLETYRGLVNAWSIDHAGHMNVQFYATRFDEASWAFLGMLGCTSTPFVAYGWICLNACERSPRRCV